MLSISNAKSAGGSISYFSDHLVEEGSSNPNEDYYAKGEAGQWLGSGAESLGLTGEVHAEDFGRMLLAVDNDGEALLLNGGNPERRAGWDLTYSAPKSVSALWAVGDDTLRDSIAEAHSEAVSRAMQFLQDDGGISGRRGKGGLEIENSKMVAAKFNHGTSREQDPQLHSHVFVMNLAQRHDGSWGAIQSKEFFSRKMAAGALYRTELSNQMQKLGFDIERDKRSFSVVGVSDKLQKHWSKRREQVKDAMAAHGGSSAKSAEAAALSSRSAKKEIEQELLIEGWKQEASNFGLDQTKIDELQNTKTENKQMPLPEEIWQEFTQQASTISEHQLKAAVFEKSQGLLSADESQKFLDNLIRDESTVILRDHSGNRRFTSLEMRLLEQSIIDSSKSRQIESNAVSKETLEQALSKVPTISDEQKKMVEHITGNGGVTLVEGAAGTGKTFALAVANDAWVNDGKNVIGAALAGKAAEGLQDGANIKSQTLHSLLMELNPNPETNQPAKKKLTSRDVVVLDESGMIGSRQMNDLLQKAEISGAKVVLVGDSKQLQPIDAGGAFRGLSKELGATELKDIRRQREGWHKQAVIEFSEGDTGKALSAFKERDLLMSGATHEETINKMVYSWKKDKNKSEDKLMLAGTRADVANLNRVAREAMKDTLTGDKAIINNKEFQKNDRVIFTSNNKKLGVKNGSLGSVIFADAETNSMTVSVDGRDKFIKVNPTEYDAIQHGYAMTVHKSQGVTTEAAFVLADERMSGQEWSYVAMSRSKGDTTIFADDDLVSELEQTMSKSHSKDLSTDFEIE